MHKSFVEKLKEKSQCVARSSDMTVVLKQVLKKAVKKDTGQRRTFVNKITELWIQIQPQESGVILQNQKQTIDRNAGTSVHVICTSLQCK